MLPLGAVRGREAFEPIAFHGPRKPLALARAHHIHRRDSFEGLDRDGFAHLVRRLRLRGQPPLADEPLGIGVGLAGVSHLRFRPSGRLDVLKTHLDRVVSVGLAGFDLCNGARPDLNDGHRRQPAGLVIHLGHPHLLAK